MKIPESELILNTDGSVYHLNLLPQDIADTIILVGDKDRVPLVSSLFDSIELKKNKREFYTHTGSYKGKRISVISSGIGTDNIDIVLNELDALANIDLKTRELKEDLKSLNFIRIGTCGTIHENIETGSYVVSDYGLGFDNLMRFYTCTWNDREKLIYDELKKHLQYQVSYTPFYLFGASDFLQKLFSDPIFYHGITITSPGFFGPQGRSLRLPLAYPNLIDSLASFELGDLKVLNFEMETSAIFGLSRLLGHHAITVDLVLANRNTKKAAINYQENMKALAKNVLESIALNLGTNEE